jgi:hypothetical protein
MGEGYSGTPLAQKLGLKPGIRCWFHNMPDSVRTAIDPEALSVEEQPTASDGLQCAHLFVTARDQLQRELAALQPLMQSNGFIWVSWPSQAAHADTDVTEDVVREVALPRGLVDIKVCAVDETWSALKLVTRHENR